jgi:hypothetical protein
LVRKNAMSAFMNRGASNMRSTLLADRQIFRRVTMHEA